MEVFFPELALDSLIRRTARFCTAIRVVSRAAVLSMFVATKCFAQITGQAEGLPAPDVSLVDEMGIDLTSGARTDVLLSLSIGSADQPSIALSYGYKPAGTPPGGEVRLVCIPGSYSPCQSSYWVFTMGYSVQYAGNGSTVLTDGSFYTISGNDFHVYSTKGEDWYFAAVPNSAGTLTGARAYLKQITMPDGRQLIYTYPSGQPSGTYANPVNMSISILSTDGYQLNSSHALMSNRRFINCPTNLPDCAASVNDWPNLTYSNPGNGYTRFLASNQQILDAKTTWAGSNDTERVEFPSGAFVEYDEIQSGCAPFVAAYAGITVSNGTIPASCSRIGQVRSSRGVWTYTYNQPPASGGVVPASGQTPWTVSSTDPAGNTTQLTEPSANTATVTDKIGRVTTYVYGGTTFQTGSVYKYFNKVISQIIRPEGDKDVYQYDSRLNMISNVKIPKAGSGLQNVAWSASYPSTCTISNFRSCNKPDYVVDPRGSRTDFVYDPAHGGITLKTLPPNADGVRATIHYAYQQLSAKYLDQTGQLIFAPPIWKLSSISQCRSLASCAGTADETITSFGYDDNLLVKEVAVTADGQTRRRCYGYDPKGNRIWETKPRAGLTSCN